MAISKRRVPSGKSYRPAVFGPAQASGWLGIATWQFETAVRRELIPPADFGDRWSMAILEGVKEDLPMILAEVGEHPPIGSNRAAERLSYRLDLEVTRADVEVLVERNLLAIASYYEDFPLYDVRDLDQVADKSARDLAGIVAERLKWQSVSLGVRAACAQLGWRRDEFERVIADRGIQPGRLGRFACTDVEDLMGDKDLVKQVLSDRLLSPDQACEYLEIRRTDFDHLGLAGLIAPRTTRWMRVGRYKQTWLPLYRVGDLDALLDVPDLDWRALRCCKEGDLSPLRELVTGRPTRTQIIHRFVAELGNRLGVGIWAYRNDDTDQWEICWEELEPGNPSKSQILEAISTDKTFAQFCAELVLSTEVGAVITWARAMLEPGAACLLDTETVDLQAPVCEIAVIDAATGETLLNSLVNPGVPISDGAFRTHGISDADIADAPTWPEVLPELLRITKDRKIVAYNADFDLRVICEACRRHHLRPGHLGVRRNWDCVMRRRSDWLGTRRWLPLAASHRALDDCLSTLGVLRSLAAPPHISDRR